MATDATDGAVFRRDHTRSLRRVILLLHMGIAAAWMYFMAGGFPLFHLRSLANRGIPATVVVLGLIGLYADRTGRIGVLMAITRCFAWAWLVASITGIALFPYSARLILPISLVVAAVLFRLSWAGSAFKERPSGLTIVPALAGAGFGFLAPFTQRAALPATHPLNLPMSEVSEGSAGRASATALSKSLRISPTDGTITFTNDRLSLIINPMLTLMSLSPDRCWTLFAPRKAREAPERKLTHWTGAESKMFMRYADIGISDLRVSAAGDDMAEIEATSQIPEATYSHLNTFCEITVVGRSKLALVFSPCPDQPIDILPMDYPIGRPERFAYLDARGLFHVVEAKSGEKGPFDKLASGDLERWQPLEITLQDAGRAVATVVLADWASQLSTDLSPTAGWGVPQNAIEFSLERESPNSMASLFISLASTSVGRGFDPVGHAPGIYRNRMTVRLLPP